LIWEAPLSSKAGRSIEIALRRGASAEPPSPIRISERSSIASPAALTSIEINTAQPHTMPLPLTVDSLDTVPEAFGAEAA
jgi:hypothetical protein